MPRKTVTAAILDTLKDLGEQNFLEFCAKLTDSEEEPRIKASEVEGKSRPKIAELLVSRYTKSRAVDRTVTALRDIGCNNEAEDLARDQPQQAPRRDRSRSPHRDSGAGQRAATYGGGPPPKQQKLDCGAMTKAADLPRPKRARSKLPPPPSAAGLSGETARQEHFVDRHRSELIDRVSNMGPILDYLLQKKVLQQEQYDKAFEISTKQDQMRFLFKGPLKAGGKQSKDVFLSALEKHQPYLIRDLRE